MDIRSLKYLVLLSCRLNYLLQYVLFANHLDRDVVK